MEASHTMGFVEQESHFQNQDGGLFPILILEVIDTSDLSVTNSFFSPWQRPYLLHL